MKLLPIAIALLAWPAAAQDVPPGTVMTTNLTWRQDIVSTLNVSNLTTNRYTNLVSTLRVTPILTRCAECGLDNHHERRIEHVEAFEVVHATLVLNGQTNQAVVYTSPKTEWTRTNIVFRTWTASPGVMTPNYSRMTITRGTNGVQSGPQPLP